MTTQETPETDKVTKETSAGKVPMSKFEKLISIILAALIGVAVVAVAMLIIAKGLQYGGSAGGIIYLVVFVVAGGFSYKYSQKLVAKFVWLRWPVLIALVIGVIYFAITLKNEGGDPSIAVIVTLLPIVFLYTILPNGTKPAK